MDKLKRLWECQWFVYCKKNRQVRVCGVVAPTRLRAALAHRRIMAPGEMVTGIRRATVARKLCVWMWW